MTSSLLAPDLELVPGVRRLRPDDHFFVIAETDASPMHVGALLVLDVPASERGSLLADMRRQFSERLPATPLLCRLAEAPEGFDASVWVALADCDLDYHVVQGRLQGEGEGALLDFVARCSMERLELSRPPFRAYVLDPPNGPAAVYLTMHHSVGDGLAFQRVLALLSDSQPPVAARAGDAVLPDATAWRELSDAGFADASAAIEGFKTRRRAARAELEILKADPAEQRSRTPLLRLSGPTTTSRDFATASLSLAEVKQVAKSLHVTLNDLFLALVSTSLRDYLISIDDLPDAPLVINSARSYRRPEHGDFGNRIVAMNPHIATSEPDPLARLRAIQAEMAREARRAPFDQAQMNAPEQPFGVRDRRARVTGALGQGATILPGNITISNVPGPEGRLVFAGNPVTGNFPAPIIGSGRFLNITSRRHADRLDLGIMTDAEKIPSAAPIAEGLQRALGAYAALAERR